MPGATSERPKSLASWPFGTAMSAPIWPLEGASTFVAFAPSTSRNGAPTGELGAGFRFGLVGAGAGFAERAGATSSARTAANAAATSARAFPSEEAI